MRYYAKLVANCGAKQLCQVKENHLPTMRNYGKLVANCGTKLLPTMRNYGKLAKSSTYYEKLW